MEDNKDLKDLNQLPILRNFTHIVIPAEIWLRRDISIQAKCLWGIINSLNEKGLDKRSLSIQELENLMLIKKSRVCEVLKELKNASLLKNIHFDGRIVLRKALNEGASHE